MVGIFVAIEKEIFQVGNRLTSVRELRNQYYISMNTALQIYIIITLER